MRITKEQVQGMLDESLKLFERHVMQVPNGVEIKWMPLEEFEEGLSQNPLYGLLIQKGIVNLKDLNFPCFTVVFPAGKHPLRQAFGLPLEINVCWEFLEGTLRPLNQKQAKTYLKSVFLHEIGHLMEEHLIDSESMFWKECLAEARGSESFAKEVFVERLAENILGAKVAQVTHEVWKPIEQKMLQS